MEKRKILAILVMALGLMVCQAKVSEAGPMGTAITHQGHLYDANQVANGLYDFQFKLFDDPNVILGNQVGSDVNKPDVDVIDGFFGVELDFGSDVFDGNAVWLEIGVRPGDLNDPNVYTTLSPRQELTPTPYAINADNLDGLSASAFAFATHYHSGSDITSGTVAEGYIDGLITRDSEIMSWVLAGDGSGSGLDADLLDGQDSAAFAPVSHSHDGVYALISHVHDDRYYTETELQSSGSASVHWDNLTNVPADIADGDDDTQLTEVQVDAYVNNNGYLDTETDPTVLASVKDGVSWAEIASIPADIADGDDDTDTQLTEAQVDAYVANNGFGTVSSWLDIPDIPADIADGDDDTQLTEVQVDTYVSNNGYLDTEIDPTVLASVKDGVSWAEIASIPADIADGDDDTDTQLTEAQVDAYVANNGYGTVSNWADIPDVPADIADGDDDTQLTEVQVDTYVSNNGYLDTEIDPTVLASVKDGVSWAEIASIPADIADGDDDTDTQLTEAQVDAYVSNNGYLDTETDPTVLASVKDGVSWAEIAGIPADIADGDNDTDTQLTEAQVDTYVLNNGYLDGSSALDWGNITIDMPAGFADGVDNVGGGDSDWTISGSDMYTGAGVTGNIGIGTSSPGEKLEVAGNIKISDTGKGLEFPDGTKQRTATARTNPMQVALLRWYEANETGIEFSVGNGPGWVCFDGANIWVTNCDDDTVTKLRASDGALQGTYSVGNAPLGLCFDGANIWVVNYSDDTVIKLRASDGALQGTYSVGNMPKHICFDGTNIWVTNFDDDTVTKLRASDGALQGTYSVGDMPHGVCFDGANIWVAAADDTVTKLRASDGALQGTYSVGNDPWRVCFDGANIWVVRLIDASVTKLRASDGALQGTYPVGVFPQGICFDGANIWVTGEWQHNVTKLRASDGALQGTYYIGDRPRGICFDGANIWVVKTDGDTVTKL